MKHLETVAAIVLIAGAGFVLAMMAALAVGYILKAQGI